MQATRALRFCSGNLDAAASFAAEERARQKARRAQQRKDAALLKENRTRAQPAWLCSWQTRPASGDGAWLCSCIGIVVAHMWLPEQSASIGRQNRCCSSSSKLLQV